jgi:hypothetical protein
MQMTDENTRLPEPLAAGPPVRQRGMFLGLLAAVFVSGGIVGGGAGMLFMQQKFGDCFRHPEKMPARLMTIFRSELDLTDQQAMKVDEIVRRHHERIEAIRAEVHPRMASEFNAIHSEVSAILNDDQRTRWDELRERFRKTFPPPKCDKPDHDRQKSTVAQ